MRDTDHRKLAEYEDRLEMADARIRELEARQSDELTIESEVVHWRNISGCFPAICGSWSKSCTYESYSAITCSECLRLRAEWIVAQSHQQKQSK